MDPTFWAASLRPNPRPLPPPPLSPPSWYKVYDPKAFAEHPKLQAYIDRIANLPRVKEYIASGQEATTWLPPPFGPMMAPGSPLTDKDKCDPRKLVSLE